MLLLVRQATQLNELNQEGSYHTTESTGWLEFHGNIEFDKVVGPRGREWARLVHGPSLI